MIQNNLTQYALFQSIDETDCGKLLTCLAAQEKSYRKNSFILRAGEPVSSIGLIISGGVQIIKEDYWGNRSILAFLQKGELFGEAFCCAGAKQLPVSAVAADETKILFLDCSKMFSACRVPCGFHSTLISNMLRILANKNISLTQKIEHISRKSTREKLISYLSAQAASCKKNKFTIPFSRQELADYLAVDRSAMSNELAKMQNQGLIQYHRNQFTLFHADQPNHNPE